MKIKKTLIAVLSFLLVLSIEFMAFAHSGRTDKNGGHRDNQNKSGLGYYHYHCGGHPPHLHPFDECPYAIAEEEEVETFSVDTFEDEVHIEDTSKNLKNQKEDNALDKLLSALKSIAEKYNIFKK